MGETEINGHAAGFFLRQPIWIDAGKGLYQGTLAVIDVASRGEDGVPLGHYWCTDKSLIQGWRLSGMWRGQGFVFILTRGIA